MMKLQRKKRNKLIKSSGPEFAEKNFLKNKEEFIAEVKDLTEPLCESMTLLIYSDFENQNTPCCVMLKHYTQYIVPIFLRS